MGFIRLLHQALTAAVSALEDRLRILDAPQIPTGYPHSLRAGASSDHCGRLQSTDALRPPRTRGEPVRAALA